MSGPSTKPIAKTQPAFSELNTSPDYVTVISKENKTVAYHTREAYKIRTQREQVLEFPATSFTAGAFSTMAAPAIFRISSKAIPGRVTSCAVRWTVSETGGSNSITPQLVPYQLNTVGQAMTFAFNSSANNMAGLTADSLYTPLQHLSNEKLQTALAFNAYNMSTTTYASPTAIAASGSQVYTMQIPNCPYCGMVVSITDGDLVITVNFNQAGILSGTGVSLLSNPVFIFYVHQNNETDEKDRADLAKKDYVIHNFPLLYPVSNALPFTNGALTSIPLSGLPRGFFAYCVLLLRASKSGTGLYTFSTLNGAGSEFLGLVGLNNAAGSNILGNAGLSGAYLRGVQQYKESKGVMTTVIPMYPLYFADEVDSFLANATLDHGYWQSDSGSTMTVTPGASFSPATLNIDILFWAQGKLKVENGQVSILSPQ